MSKSRDIADSAATINFIDNLTSDAQTQLNTLDTAVDNISVTSGTLTKTFAQDEVATITLSSSITTPVVSVTKEVSQTGTTNNTWDVNSTSENYTRLDSATATTLDFVGFDVSTASFVDSFSVASEDTVPRGVAFNTDGTKMFVGGYAGQDVNEYTLTTGFDVSTATYSQNFSVSSQDTLVQGIAFNNDGTKMFVVGDSGNAVYEYTLSTGFDVSTATYSQNFSVSTQDTGPRGIAFNTDGTKMFVVGDVGKDVNEYTLSTAFDLSTASYSQNFSVNTQETGPTDISFNADGTKMFIVGRDGDEVNEYTLSTGFDVSTATYSQNFSISGQESVPVGIAFNTAGTKMFIVGSTGDAVYEYSLDASLQLGSGSFASADVGKTIEANSGVFVLTSTAGAFSETTAPTSYDQVASGDWEMYAVVYNTTDGDLELSNKTDKYSIQAASYDSVSFDFSSQETAITGIAFNNDGTKLFATGRTGDDVNEYTLSTAYDPSTATYVRNFSVSSQETNPRGLLFSPDGTKMYVSGSSSQQVHKYNLTTGYDLSTASYSNSTLNVSNQDSWPTGMAWNADGTVIFVVGQTNNRVNGYSCPSAYDAAGGSHISNYTISQDNSATDVAFNADGTKMFVSGKANDKVYEYSLSSAYTVNSSTASYVRDFSVAAQENQPSGLIFNNDGSKMYIAGEQTNDIFQYSTVDVSAPSGYHAVHTTNSTDSTYWTDINSMTADEAAGDGSIYYAVSTDDRTTWKIADNTDGIRSIVRNNSGTWQYNSNATYGSETWTNATTNTELNALQEAMTGVQSPYELSESTQIYGLSISAYELEPQDLFVKDDGTEIYISAGAGLGVDQFTLSTAFDLSTATHTAFQSTSSQGLNPRGLTFKSDGTKMYECHTSTADIKQYSLSTAWDITTLSYDSVAFVVSGQVTGVRGVSFKSDGTKMFVVGSASSVVAEYDLSTAWDISTATYNSVSYNFSSQAAGGESLSIQNNGTTMLIGYSDLHKYTLSTAWDITSASFVETFDAGSGAFVGAMFGDSGEKLYYTHYSGTQADTIQEYTATATATTNQMNKTQLDAVSDANHFTLSNDLDLAIVFNMTSGTTVPSSDGVSINYDANVLNKGAILGTDYDYDAPAQNKVRITALTGNNLKVRVV